jgi:hypothetical protein
MKFTCLARLNKELVTAKPFLKLSICSLIIMFLIIKIFYAISTNKRKDFIIRKLKLTNYE